MANYKSMGAYALHLEKLSRDTRGEIAKDTVTAMSERATEIAEKYARRDVGADFEMRGWPAALLGTKIKETRAGHGAVLLPYNRAAAAGWTVNERGRNRGDAVGFQGPGVNRTTGVTARTKRGAVRKVRERKAKRWNGYTRAKGTASDAQAEMEREVPKAAGRLVQKTFIRRLEG